MSLITKIRKRIADGHRVLIHCYGGLGRAVLVAACLVMTIDEDVFTDEVRIKNSHCQFSEFSFILFLAIFLVILFVKNCATNFFVKSQHTLLDFCHLTNFSNFL